MRHLVQAHRLNLEKLGEIMAAIQKVFVFRAMELIVLSVKKKTNDFNGGGLTELKSLLSEKEAV
jgi:hypothetical protein